MKVFIQRVLAFAGTLAMIAAPIGSQAQTVTATFNPGDLIKGVSFSSVFYFAPDGKRYVFPNEKTYFTWFENFDGVKTISDGALGTIPIGGNVTYRPGVKMVKITTDPKVYVIEQGGILRHVDSEEIAETLYGLNWNNRIDDIPDPFFINYTVGTKIVMASEYDPEAVKTQTTAIAQDKQMTFEDASISIGNVENSFVPQTITVKVGTTVTWMNRDILDHTVSSDTFNSPVIPRDGSYQRRFTAAGTYSYNCSIHPSMAGTINVVP